LNWILLAKVSFDLFALRRQDHPLPFHFARVFTVFSHHIPPFIKHKNQTVRLGSLEMKGSRWGLVLSHSYSLADSGVVLIDAPFSLLATFLRTNIFVAAPGLRVLMLQLTGAPQACGATASALGLLRQLNEGARRVER